MLSRRLPCFLLMYVKSMPARLAVTAKMIFQLILGFERDKKIAGTIVNWKAFIFVESLLGKIICGVNV